MNVPELYTFNKKHQLINNQYKTVTIVLFDSLQAAEQHSREL